MLSFMVAISFCLLRASQREMSLWLGAAAGLVTWLAMVSTYAAGLTIADLLELDKYPNRQPNPRWLVPTIWCIWLVSVTGAVLLLRPLVCR